MSPAYCHLSGKVSIWFGENVRQRFRGSYADNRTTCDQQYCCACQGTRLQYDCIGQNRSAREACSETPRVDLNPSPAHRRVSPQNEPLRQPERNTTQGSNRTKAQGSASNTKHPKIDWTSYHGPSDLFNKNHAGGESQSHAQRADDDPQPRRREMATNYRPLRSPET